MSEFDFTTFVRNLPKEKLVGLVLKYAPESYREEVSNQNLEEDQARKTFDKVVKQIKSLFKDDELLYKPSDFAFSLTVLSEKLSGLWDRYPDETKELILFCVNKIDALQYEGLLYDDYHDDIFDGAGFLTIVQNFILQLPFGEKLVFVESFEQSIGNYNYDAFFNYSVDIHLNYSDSEIPLVKENFIQTIGNEEKPFRKEYYRFLKDFLTNEEKEYVLTKIYHLDKRLCLELVDILVDLGKPNVAIDYLEALREANPNAWIFTEDLFVKLIYLKSTTGIPFLDELKSGLKTYKTNTLLNKANEFSPEERYGFESIVKSVSHFHFLKYLIDNTRIQEAYELIKQSQELDNNPIYDFYGIYGKRYPEDATDFFIQMINKELPYTGDRHYESIVNSLRHIQKWNASKANEIIMMLRVNYKRRRNLMAMLERI